MVLVKEGLGEFVEVFGAGGDTDGELVGFDGGGDLGGDALGDGGGDDAAGYGAASDGSYFVVGLEEGGDAARGDGVEGDVVDFVGGE